MVAHGPDRSNHIAGYRANSGAPATHLASALRPLEKKDLMATAPSTSAAGTWSRRFHVSSRPIINADGSTRDD